MHFFTPETLVAHAATAGLAPRVCRWATVQTTNRATGKVLRRVYVHGEFVRAGE